MNKFIAINNTIYTMKAQIIAFSLMLLASAIGFYGCKEGDKFDYNQDHVYVTGTEISPLTRFVVDDVPSSYAVTASATDKVSQDVNVKFAIDTALVSAFNAANKTNYYPIPADAVELEHTDAVIQKGKAFSTPATVKVVSTDNFKDGRIYLIPVTMKQVKGLNILESSRTIFLRVSRVIKFRSLNISNTNLYSNFIFPDNKKLELSQFTYEVKCYSEDWHRIARLCSFTSKDEQRSSMLRFGENGQDINALQWVSPSGNIMSTTRFATNRWYMISLTYDGKKLTMYVDGAKDAEANGDGKPVTFQRFELGMSWTSYRGSQYFKGRMAEVRVWNRALSGSEIQNGLAGVDPSSLGLMAYWKMNEGEGHIFKDATGHGYDMDWSKTAREVSEGAGLKYNLDYSSAIAWDYDDNNKCNQ